MATMDDATFWGLIGKLNWKRAGDDEAVVAPVVKALAATDEPTIAAFQNTLTEKLYALDGRAWARESGKHVWWGKGDSLSVDGFLYSRAVVVANGRKFYDAVLADPTQMPKDVEFESLLYIGVEAIEKQQGEDCDEIDGLSDLSYETFSNRAGWPELPDEPPSLWKRWLGRS